MTAQATVQSKVQATVLPPDKLWKSTV